MIGPDARLPDPDRTDTGPDHLTHGDQDFLLRPAALHITVALELGFLAALGATLLSLILTTIRELGGVVIALTFSTS